MLRLELLGEEMKFISVAYQEELVRAKVVGRVCSLSKINCFQHWSSRATRKAMKTGHAASEPTWPGFRHRLCHLPSPAACWNFHVPSLPSL